MFSLIDSFSVPFSVISTKQNPTDLTHIEDNAI